MSISGNAKTDARDTFVVADAARALAHTLRWVNPAEDSISELSVLTGYDDDLAADLTRTNNRLRSLLNQVHPALDASWALGCNTLPSVHCWPVT